MNRLKKPGRRLPSPALVIALLAFFVALGGSAYAMTKINGSQIKNGSISLAKLNRHARIATVNLPASGPGLPGAEGKEGKEGAAGHNGSDGADGKAGQAGSDGATGATGSQGAQGPQGNPGTPGATGSQGDQGNPGSPGAQGPQGDQGPAGPQGPQGASGLNSGDPRVVTETESWGWKLATYGDNSETPEPGLPNGRGSEPANVVNGTLGFDTPPSPPSLGTKSLKMTTDGHPVVAYPPLPIGNAPLLSELTSAGYDSLVAASPSEDADVALQIEVTKSSAPHFGSGYTTVVFEPYQNNEPTVVGAWHHHVLAAGGQRSGLVWSTQALPGSKAHPCSQAVPCELSQFIEENPAAVVSDVKFRIGQNSGEGWSGFEAYVDDVRLGFGEYTRYDLGG